MLTISEIYFFSLNAPMKHNSDTSVRDSVFLAGIFFKFIKLLDELYFMAEIKTILSYAILLQTAMTSLLYSERFIHEFVVE